LPLTSNSGASNLTHNNWNGQPTTTSFSPSSLAFSPPPQGNVKKIVDEKILSAKEKGVQESCFYGHQDKKGAWTKRLRPYTLIISLREHAHT
jgi:hypothetical protein